MEIRDHRHDLAALAIPNGGQLQILNGGHHQAEMVLSLMSGQPNHALCSSLYFLLFTVHIHLTLESRLLCYIHYY